ncbi:MAG: metal ABC transporter ATP-binding protein [Candidatus Nanoarchaeia archaeon]
MPCPENTMASIIKVQNVSFSYYRGQDVLTNVSMNVNEQDFLGIIGPNGGGKSTLLKLILGLITPTNGLIEVFGKSPVEGREQLGYVPQYFSFDFDFPMTVLDVVLMGRLKIKKMGKGYSKADLRAAIDSLKKVEMQKHKNRQIAELSGGERQRILIARALAVSPKALVLDEPVSSIDSAWQPKFYNLLKELNKKIAIILVTHNVGMISSYVDKIACLNKTLHYHGETQEGIDHLSKSYKCPVELIAHGVPHRVLGEHK